MVSVYPNIPKTGKWLAILFLFNTYAVSLMGQCAGFPATTADADCAGGTILTSTANINPGDHYSFCGSSASTATYNGVNLAGGILRICGNVNLTGTWNSGIIVVSCGSTVNFTSGLFLNSNVGIVNYGKITVTGDITFQNPNNYVYNEATNAQILVSGNVIYPSNNGQNAYLKNNGYIKISGTFDAYEGGFTCLGPGSIMETLNILYNSNCGGPADRFTVSSGTAIIRYTGHSALKAVATTYAGLKIYQATGSTQTLTCGGGWGSATVVPAAPAVSAPSGTQTCPSSNCFTVLAITSTPLTCTLSDNRVTLYWTAIAGGNNSSFEIDRSADGLHWAALLTVPGPAIGGASVNYLQYDYNPYKGENFYRLKQINADGSFSYSGVITIFNDNTVQKQLVVYPNPVHAGKTMSLDVYSAAGVQTELSFVDMTGRVIYRSACYLAAGNNTVNCTIPDIPQGIYTAILQLPATGSSHSKPFLVVK